MEEIKTVNTTKLLYKLEDQNSVIIDSRSVNAYNGWQLMNEPRGGHIKGARCLPAKWTNYMDWIEVVKSKNILSQNNIIIYGYTEEDNLKVANSFLKNGFHNISVYNNFLNEWTVNPNLPMQKLERYKYLVSPAWVKKVIDGKIPKEHNGHRTVICHTHYRNPEAYTSGHIPGAISLDTLALEAPETWNRRSPEELKQSLEQHGITSDTCIILYGKYMHPDNGDEFPGSAAGHIGAIRCAFIMMYAGVKDVRVLNGGYQAWEDEGYEISVEDVKKEPANDFGLEIPAQPNLAVDIGEAKKMLTSKTSELVSVRSWPEFIGEVSGYNYIEKKGRIPGAIFGNCGTDAYHMENYRNVDLTTREYHEIESIWKETGITPDKHLAFYCGTGWRGSEAFYNAWLMGWPRVSVFDGGWFEWSNDHNNPYETGIPDDLNN